MVVALREPLALCSDPYSSYLRVFAALENPKLFSSLILIDPVIIKPYDREEQGLVDVRTTGLILGALNRRTTWSSKYITSPAVLSRY